MHIAILYKVLPLPFRNTLSLYYYFKNFSLYINNLYSIFNFTVSVWIFMLFFVL